MAPLRGADFPFYGLVEVVASGEEFDEGEAEEGVDGGGAVAGTVADCAL